MSSLNYRKKSGSTAIGFNGPQVRAARVGEHLSLAVIKLERHEVIKTARTERLAGISGVFQVHADAPRNTIQILYDGECGTAKQIVRLLFATAAKSPSASRNVGQ